MPFDRGRGTRHVAASAAIAVLVGLAGCQSGGGKVSAPGAGKSAALRTMEQVAIAAHKCWFAGKDPAFRAYQMANELNSFSGRPRFLLVPAKNYGARPLLVVQAEGQSTNVAAFGPLIEGPLGPRISADIGRWSTGDPGCSAAA